MEVGLIEDSELGMAPPLAPFARLVNRLSRLAADLPLGMAAGLLTSAKRRVLNDAGMLIATTNGMGLALAIAKMLGLVKAPVVLLAMGLLPNRPTRWQRLLIGACARRLHIVCISKGEQAHLEQWLQDTPVHYVPFGVDAAFWRPEPEPSGGYALAIGNDRNRDWATLVAAWSADLPPLKIVTGLAVPPAQDNVEVIRGDWRTQALSDEQIRVLLQNADFVIVPCRETMQPAGQSATLQAMACGKAVILSNIAGLWDRELLVDGDTVELVPPGDAAALADKARLLATDPAFAAALGAKARTVVEEHLNVDAMASALADLLPRIATAHP
ncbi:MAG: glycosyltransferase [Candidatus Competibacteraceae bacterium]|nr:glycosyltransferase [Candidatus Competibacteraceae bacterium]